MSSKIFIIVYTTSLLALSFTDSLLSYYLYQTPGTTPEFTFLGNGGSFVSILLSPTRNLILALCILIVIAFENAPERSSRNRKGGYLPHLTVITPYFVFLHLLSANIDSILSLFGLYGHISWASQTFDNPRVGPAIMLLVLSIIFLPLCRAFAYKRYSNKLLQQDMLNP